MGLDPFGWVWGELEFTIYGSSFVAASVLGAQNAELRKHVEPHGLGFRVLGL